MPPRLFGPAKGALNVIKRPQGGVPWRGSQEKRHLRDNKQRGQRELRLRKLISVRQGVGRYTEFFRPGGEVFWFQCLASSHVGLSSCYSSQFVSCVDSFKNRCLTVGGLHAHSKWRWFVSGETRSLQVEATDGRKGEVVITQGIRWKNS